MSYGNWDEIIKLYEFYAALEGLRERYLRHVNAMLTLIPEIRADVRFDDCIPFQSHATLCMRLPNYYDQICVYNDAPNVYRVYIHKPDIYDEVFYDVEVTHDKILDTLVDYLQKIPLVLEPQ